MLESTPLDFAVCVECRRLKAAGYKIALDDFTFNDPRECLVDLADFIKVDLRLTEPAKAKEIAERYKSSHHLMLAEKVETREEFQFAKQAGFQFFQGFYFSRPQMVCTRSIFADCPTCLSPSLTVPAREEHPAKSVKSIRGDAGLRFCLFR